MKLKYLAIVALMATCGAGRTGETPENFSTLRAAAKPGRSDYSPGDGVTRTSFYTGLEFAIVSSSGKTGGQPLSGNGLMYRTEMGAKIPLHLKLGYKQYLLSIGLSYSSFSNKTTYGDGIGGKVHADYSIAVVGMPFSYAVSTLNKKGGPLGYYWQLGGNAGLVTRVKQGERNMNSAFNNFMLSASGSAGISFTFDGAEGKLSRGTMMLGLLVEDDLTNLAAGNGASMHALFYGLRYAFVLT